MKDSGKTKLQLSEELAALRRRVADLEKAESEHQAARLALKESETLYRALIDTSPDSILVYSIDGEILAANAQAAKAFGKATVAELLADVETAWHLFTEESGEQAKANLRRIVAEGISLKNEYTVRISNGNLIPVEINSSLVRSATGEPRAVICVIREIADRKRAEEALRQSEARYRLIAENTADLISIMDMNLRFTYVSPASLRFRGFTVEEALSQSLEEVLNPASLKLAYDVYNEEMEREASGTADPNRMRILELEEYKKDGTTLWAEVSLSFLRDEKGKPIEILIVTRDVTERKQAEEALKESEEQHRILLQESPDPTFSLTPEGRYKYANRAFAEGVGKRVEEIIGRSMWDIFSKEEADKRFAALSEVFHTGEQKHIDVRVPLPDGDRYYLTTINPVKGTKGETISAFCTSKDITDRKKMEEALQKSEREKSAILDAMSEIVIYLDLDLNILWSNSAMNRQFRMAPDQFLGKHCYEALHRRLQPCRVCPAVTAKKTGMPCIVEDFPSYGKRWTLLANPVRNEAGEVVGYVEIVTDITERKQAEDELRESRRQLSDIISFLPDATLVIDKEGKVIAWNRAIVELTGVKEEEMLGKGNREYALPFYGERRPILIDLALHPDAKMERRYTAIQRAGDALFGESYTPNLPGGDIHLSATASVLRDSKGEVIAAIECIRDNTERKRMEERLNRAEKMEGLGRLAGGVAHDLNNVLGVLVGYAELLSEKLTDDNPLKRYALSIQQSGLRGSAIIEDLLTLARRGVTISEVVDLNKIVGDYLRTPEFETRKSGHSQIKIRTELADGLLRIKGSPLHLGKTVMNLVLNALEASSGRGSVTIRTENRYFDKSVRGYDDIEQGEYAVLEVSDDGKGIPAHDIGKIFEPFYTKKVMGKSGTGLGLAVVWGTVKDHHGHIEVASEEGEGTTFTLYFPVTREEPAPTKEMISPSLYQGRGESILVVDDVQDQRELATSMLESLGYGVEAAAGGEAAVAYLRDKKVDLVLLDMIMEPGIDGLETYLQICETHPAQKAVIVSGFAETDRVRKAQEAGAGPFVRKPYIMEKIGLAIRRELDR